MNPDHLTILTFLGWQPDAKPGLWENPSLGVFGVAAPELSLELAHEAEGKLSDEQHAVFRDFLHAAVSRDVSFGDAERSYVSAEVTDRVSAIVQTLEVERAQAEEESSPEQTEEEAEPAIETA